MIKSKYTQLIDDYLEGVMTSNEKSAFEKELKNNQELNQEFELHKDLNQVIADEKVLDFRAILIDVQNDHNNEQKSKPKVFKIFRKYRYAAASVILLLLIIGSILILNPRNYSNEKLFNMYYKPGDAIGITRSGNIDVVDAVMKFHNGDYENACSLFNEVLSEDGSNMAIRYYYGIASIEVHNYNLAIEQFQEIIKDNNNLYIEYAQWYLGLSYLANNQENEAMEQIGAIAADHKHFYKDDARKLYDRIKKNKK